MHNRCTIYCVSGFVVNALAIKQKVKILKKTSKMSTKLATILFITVLVICQVFCIEEKNRINKDPRDYTDADLEKLMQQWDVGFFSSFSNENLSE